MMQRQQSAVQLRVAARRAASSGTTTETAWFRDPLGLVSPPERLLRFFPVPEMTFDERLNALVRLAAYAAAALLAAGHGPAVLLLPVAVALATFAAHVASAERGEVAGDAALAAGEQGSPRGLATLHEGMRGGDGGDGRGATAALRSPTGCTRPTNDNPFMNVLQHEYAETPERPAACDIRDPSVRGLAERSFERAGSAGGLARDADDPFGRRTSSRQFVTNPSTTIPNDQGAFASWLYGIEPRVKGQAVTQEMP